MGLIKEPKNVDLSTKSEPWTEQELTDFRKIMHDIKAKNAKRKERALRPKTNKTQTAWQAQTAYMNCTSGAFTNWRRYAA